AGLLTAAELDSLVSRRRRRAARKGVAAHKGPGGERLAARLQHAQIGLALSESNAAPDREVRLKADRELILGLRAQLDALPDLAPGHAVATAAGGSVGTVAPTAFVPTHRVPVEGLPAWPTPNGTGPATPLAGGLDLEIVQRAADWAQVRASNGWTGWVDGRRLLPKAPPA
ncbi:MAG: hypothetical protein ACREBE_01985, partial [bacterium]